MILGNDGCKEEISDRCDLISLRSVFESHVKNVKQLNIKAVPRMDQPHFMTLWKTLFNIFQIEPDQQKGLCDALYSIGICQIV